MKRITLLTALVAWMAAVAPALAVDTTQVYSSGLLIIGFLGLCALVIIAQLAPAMFLLIGMLKGIAENLREKVLVRARQKQ